MLSDLIVQHYQEFLAWGWTVLGIGVGVMAASFWRWSHDSKTSLLLERLNDVPVNLALAEDDRLVGTLEPTDRSAPTAIVCVTSFSGFGRHLVAAVCRLFPRYFTNFIFISAAVSESRLFKDSKGPWQCREAADRALGSYVAWGRTHGLRAGRRTASSSEKIPVLYEICRELVQEYPRSVVVIGRPIFRDREYPRSSYNRIATALERRLRFDDIQTIVLPIAVPDS